MAVLCTLQQGRTIRVYFGTLDGVQNVLEPERCM